MIYQPRRFATFTLSWPTSTNKLRQPVNMGGGRARLRTSSEYSAWKERAAIELLTQKVPRLKLAEPVQLWILARPPDTSRRRDVSNIIKATEDALVRHGLLEDDWWIDASHQKRGSTYPGGRVECAITSMEGVAWTLGDAQG